MTTLNEVKIDSTEVKVKIRGLKKGVKVTMNTLTDVHHIRYVLQQRFINRWFPSLVDSITFLTENKLFREQKIVCKTCEFSSK